MNKQTAQKRVDQIKAFIEELDQLEQKGVLVLHESDKLKLQEYHDSILLDFSNKYDVDISNIQKQMSWGMRLVSLLGSLAISAAVFFFFYKFWGRLSTIQQVFILVLSPLLSLVGIEIAARREKTLYFASLISLVALACFILNLSVLGKIFNIIPSQNAFLAWGTLAMLIAYFYRLRLILVAGILCLMGYLTATIGTWSGCYWLSFGERPENFIVTGFILFLVPAIIPHKHHFDFPPIYRLFGLLTIFIATLILANWGLISYLTLSSDMIEHMYQALGFLLSGIAIWLGIRKNWLGVTNLGATFFVIFLYTKFFDWWWDWMPKYLFFLVLGLIAVALLFVMKRLRGLTMEAHT